MPVELLMLLDRVKCQLACALVPEDRFFVAEKSVAPLARVVEGVEASQRSMPKCFATAKHGHNAPPMAVLA